MRMYGVISLAAIVVAAAQCASQGGEAALSPGVLKIDKALPGLTASLTNENPRIRAEAAMALVQLGSDRGVTALATWLTNDVWKIDIEWAIRASRALAEIKSPDQALWQKVIASWIEHFKSGDMCERWKALTCLKCFQDRQNVRDVIGTTLNDLVLYDICELGANPWNDPKYGNCKWAAYRLGERKDPRAVAPLKAARAYWAADSEVVTVCTSALSALGASE